MKMDLTYTYGFEFFECKVDILISHCPFSYRITLLKHQINMEQTISIFVSHHRWNVNKYQCAV